MSIDLLGRFVPIPFADSSVFYLLRQSGLSPLPALSMLAVFGLGAALWFWRSGVRDRPDLALLPGIAGLAFLLDLFLPALRNIYNDVLILNVIALFLARPTGGWHPAALTALVAMLIGWLSFAMPFRSASAINLPVLLFTGLSLWLLLSAVKKTPSPVVERVKVPQGKNRRRP